jgi:hypothetical protein
MTTLKLMPDYQCHPLWEASFGKMGNIDPNSLPISIALRNHLSDWACEYDKTLNWDDPASSGFSCIKDIEIFKEKGEKLASQLRKELGSNFTVISNLSSIGLRAG